MNPKTYNLKLTKHQIETLMNELDSMALIKGKCGNKDNQTIFKITAKAGKLLKEIEEIERKENSPLDNMIEEAYYEYTDEDEEE